MSTQHTPGPWTIRNGTEVFCGRKRVCHVNAASKEPLNIMQDRQVAEANARLIAAAPELLDALKWIADQTYDPWTNGAEAQRHALNAIAKATTK